MQGIVEPLKAMGVSLVAISPQVPARSLAMVENKPLGFELLSDPGNAYAASLGLRFKVPAEVEPIYRGFGINLAESNGDDSWTLPMPARLVVDGAGVVRDISADPDYTVRPEPAETLE
ncbi:MAG: putative peroxiredoxin, partial [Pseudomonadota bacterium]